MKWAKTGKWKKSTLKKSKRRKNTRTHTQALKEL